MSAMSGQEGKKEGEWLPEADRKEEEEKELQKVRLNKKNFCYHPQIFFRKKFFSSYFLLLL